MHCLRIRRELLEQFMPWHHEITGCWSNMQLACNSLIPVLAVLRALIRLITFNSSDIGIITSNSIWLRANAHSWFIVWTRSFLSAKLAEDIFVLGPSINYWNMNIIWAQVSALSLILWLRFESDLILLDHNLFIDVFVIFLDKVRRTMPKFIHLGKKTKIPK